MKKRQLQFKEVVASIDIDIKNNITKEVTTVKSEEERLPAKPIDQDAAYINVKGGATVKLHDFNMGRIDISLSYPCYPDQIDDVYDKVKDWVDTRLSTEVSQLREYADDKVKKGKI